MATIVDIYCRTATEDIDTLTRLQGQERSCRAYLEADRLSIGMVHTEIGSGATMNRPLLRVLQGRYRSGIIQGVIVTHLYRLARTLTLTADLIREIEQAGATLYIVNDDSTTIALIHAMRAITPEV